MMTVFYIALAINIVGVILLGVFAARYYLSVKAIRKIPDIYEEVKDKWAANRRLSMGLIFGGLTFMMIATGV